VPEPGDVDHLAEQLAKQEQPDHRLDQPDRDERGLAEHGVQFAPGQIPGVAQGGGEQARLVEGEVGDGHD
jgi:hypothetical protein